MATGWAWVVLSDVDQRIAKRNLYLYMVEVSIYYYLFYVWEMFAYTR